MEARTRHVILATVLIAIASLSVGLSETSRVPTALLQVNAFATGPIQFVEIYFLAGQDLERRSPKVEEEFIVKANIRNIGSAVIYYLPTLCDSSLSAIFDPVYVRVESGRPRCLAASMPRPLNPGEEAVVWAPESGTAYVAIRSGSTTATAIFTYNADAHMEQSTQAEARSTSPLIIEVKPGTLPIPELAIPIVVLILAFVLALGVFLYPKSIKSRVIG